MIKPDRITCTAAARVAAAISLVALRVRP